MLTVWFVHQRMLHTEVVGPHPPVAPVFAGFPFIISVFRSVFFQH